MYDWLPMFEWLERKASFVYPILILLGMYYLYWFIHRDRPAPIGTGWISSVKNWNRRKKVRVAATGVTLFLVSGNIWWFIQLAPKSIPIPAIEYSDFVDLVKSGKIKKVSLMSDEVQGKLARADFEHLIKAEKIKKEDLQTIEAGGPLPDEVPFKVVYSPLIVKPSELLTEHNVAFTFERPVFETGARHMLAFVLMTLTIGAWIYFVFYDGIGPNGRISLRFWVASGQRFLKNWGKVTFKDVAGIDEAKAKLQDLVEFLKDPEKFGKLGGRLPKGTLMVGPPGNGKTLLARAVAGEANVPFYSITGSDFVEMFVGVGPMRVRGFFGKGKAAGRCILFIDEIDAIGGKRSDVASGGEREYQNTLNQMLTELDGFDQYPSVVVMAATNRPEILDEALVRTGRFNRRVFVGKPDMKGRAAIIDVYLKKRPIPIGEDVKVIEIAKMVPGYSGSDCENLVNEAAILASKNGRKSVMRSDFLKAKDEILVGPDMDSRDRSEADMKVSRYHEAGHAFLAAILKYADPIEKVTTAMRGATGGALQTISPEEIGFYSQDYLWARLVMTMGGRVAESEFLGTVTTGAAHDIEAANGIARSMVTEWGMSEIGPITLENGQTDLRSGNRMRGRPLPLSEETLERVDRAVRELVLRAESTARDLLREHQVLYHKLVKRLRKKGVVEGKELYRLVGRKLKNSVSVRLIEEKKIE